MVVSNLHFLIDATFIIEKTHKSFLGASLFVIEDQDYTFLYGFLRDFLRIRQTIGVCNGVIAVSKEAYTVTDEKNIQQVINLINEMRIPYIFDHETTILDISAKISSQISYIITQEKKLLYLASDDLSVIFPNDLKNLKKVECMTPSVIKSKIGVDPENIPTFFIFDTVYSIIKLDKISGNKAYRIVSRCEWHI